MSAQPKYVMQPDFDKALTAFSGYVDHTVNLTKADIRREIIVSEDRLRTEFQTEIRASEARLQTQIQASEDRLRAEMQASEARLRTEFQAEIQASEARLRAEFQASEARMKQQIDRVENVGKSNHQLLQIMLDQFSRINKKLGID